MRATLLDTGPIVALLVGADLHHGAVVAALDEARGAGRTICTTWEAVGEAYTLIRVRVAQTRSAAPALTVLRWVEESGVRVLPAGETDHRRAAALLRRHLSLRLSYVDALVLALAERHHVEEVMSVDGRHFGAVHLRPMPVVRIV